MKWKISPARSVSISSVLIIELWFVFMLKIYYWEMKEAKVVFATRLTSKWYSKESWKTGFVLIYLGSMLIFCRKLIKYLLRHLYLVKSIRSFQIKWDWFCWLYYKNSYLEIRKSNFYVLYVKKHTKFCSFRIYIFVFYKNRYFQLVLTV